MAWRCTGLQQRASGLPRLQSPNEAASAHRLVREYDGDMSSWLVDPQYNGTSGRLILGVICYFNVPGWYKTQERWTAFVHSMSACFLRASGGWQQVSPWYCRVPLFRCLRVDLAGRIIVPSTFSRGEIARRQTVFTLLLPPILSSCFLVSSVFQRLLRPTWYLTYTSSHLPAHA